MIVYLDASAVVPLIKAEDSSEAVAGYFDDLLTDGHLLVGGQLLETEVRRAAIRQGIDDGTASEALAAVNLVAHQGSDFVRAGSLPYPNLGSLDAMHLATALRIGVDCMITLDTRLEAAAQDSGLEVLDTSIPRSFI